MLQYEPRASERAVSALNCKAQVVLFLDFWNLLEEVGHEVMILRNIAKPSYFWGGK